MSTSQPSRGGKADGLQRLQSLGLAIPPFVVIPHEELVDSANSLRHSRVRIEHAVRHVVIGLSKQGTFAVRSSASLEDGATDSFAGLFATALHVKFSDLADAIELVAGSARTPRVEAYLQERGLSPTNLIINVVVQEMVAADASGVAFGADPVSGLLDVTVIAAAYGLGEGLVDGSLNGDSFLLLQNGKVRSEQISTQHKQLTLAASGAGTAWVDVAPERAKQPKLSQRQLTEVHKTVQQLNSKFRGPQDVEFAFADEQLYVLQSRPITTLSNKLQVYDNANIIESYPGITLPLTFSFIEKMYGSVYRQLSEVLGVRPARVQHYRAVYDNMLAHLDGRVYYNLNSWYGVLSLLPGYRLNAAAMERMMGVKHSLELAPLPQLGLWRARLDVVRGGWGMLRSFFGLDRSRRNFKATFEEVLNEYKALNFTTLSDEDLSERYFKFEQTLVNRWRAPLVNDFFAMVFFSALQGLIRKWQLPRPHALHNDLLAGSNDVISIEPAQQTLSLAEAIAAQPEARALVLADGSDRAVAIAFWEALQSRADFSPLRTRIEAYLDQWGARTMGELKLETRTYEQDPVAYIEVLRAYVRQDIRSSATAHAVSTARKEAEGDVAQHLNGWRKPIFNWVLKQTRTLVSERENLRYARTRGFAMVRKMMDEVGSRLHSKQLVQQASDVYFLTQSEALGALVVSAAQGASDLPAQIEQTKLQYEQFAASTPPERISVRGDIEAALATLRRDVVASRAAESGAEVLRGTPCCAGKVRARVRVVHDPSELNNLQGGILVTRSTDPGWITLFPSAAAILVERGSLLSHAAIVSREFGIPCIVGIDNLLDTLRTGDTVEMDGASGEIKILSRG